MYYQTTNLAQPATTFIAGVCSHAHTPQHTVP